MSTFALIVTVLALIWTARREHARWLMDKRAGAYGEIVDSVAQAGRLVGQWTVGEPIAADNWEDTSSSLREAKSYKHEIYLSSGVGQLLDDLIVDGTDLVIAAVRELDGPSADLVACAKHFTSYGNRLRIYLEYEVQRYDFAPVGKAHWFVSRFVPWAIGGVLARADALESMNQSHEKMRGYLDHHADEKSVGDRLPEVSSSNAAASEEGVK